VSIYGDHGWVMVAGCHLAADIREHGTPQVGGKRNNAAKLRSAEK
jgi:hypothetical protein